MRYLYNISLYLYYTALYISSFFNQKSRKIVTGQKEILWSIQQDTQNQDNIVWFHCSSLGEFEEGKYLILEYQKKWKNHTILITFFSPSGYEVIKKKRYNMIIHYLPYDTIANTKKFVKTIKPIKAIFIRSEFWFNYIIELKENNIPIYSVSSNFRKEQYFFKFHGIWFANQLSKITHFFVQNHKSKNLLNTIMITQISITGNSRIDTIHDNSNKKFSNNIIKLFVKNSKILIAGSTHKEDEKIIMKFISENPEWKIIIVPHELNNCKKIKSKVDGILLSEATINNINKYNTLIVDQIGILSKIYQYSSVAYIGGGFGNGIHNILEPIIYQKPVIFGPNYKKFNEANELIKLGIAKSIKHENEITCSVVEYAFREQDELYSKYINKNIGASKKILEVI